MPEWVLIPVQRLVDGLRHPRSRADEVAVLRRRLAAAPGPGAASAEEVEAALAIRRLKVELAAAFGAPSSCGGCARGHPLPHGRWSGGHCCSGRTEEIFTDAELSVLRLSGTTPARLTLPPPSDHAGCAFRGPERCSLEPGDRPALCAAYVCRDLEAELRERGAFGPIKALRAELRAAASQELSSEDIGARVASSTASSPSPNTLLSGETHPRTVTAITTGPR